MTNLNYQTNNHKPRFNLFKYKKLMAMYPFNDFKSFEKWLDKYDLSYEEFINFFNKIPNSNKLIHLNPWIIYLKNNYVPAIKIPNHFDNLFSVFTDFIVEKATFEIKHKLSKITNKHKNHLNVLIFKKHFTQEHNQLLTEISSPFLNLEYKISIESNKFLETNLKEHFNHFIKQLTDMNYIISFFQEYYYLLEKLISTTHETLSDITQLFSRLIVDYKNLCSEIEPLGSLCSISNHKSNNQKNKICHFEKVRLIYKVDQKNKNNYSWAINTKVDEC